MWNKLLRHLQGYLKHTPAGRLDRVHEEYFPQHFEMLVHASRDGLVLGVHSDDSIIVDGYAHHFDKEFPYCIHTKDFTGSITLPLNTRLVLAIDSPMASIKGMVAHEGSMRAGDGVSCTIDVTVAEPLIVVPHGRTILVDRMRQETIDGKLAYLPKTRTGKKLHLYADTIKVYYAGR